MYLRPPQTSEMEGFLLQLTSIAAKLSILNICGNPGYTSSSCVTISWITQTAALEEVILEWFNAMRYNTMLTRYDTSVIFSSKSRGITKCCLLREDALILAFNWLLNIEEKVDPSLKNAKIRSVNVIFCAESIFSRRSIPTSPLAPLKRLKNLF